MSPRRLSRQESAARTKARLLDIAEKEFLRRGYAATSLDRIAETAGYSKGAVYGNFSSKEELCLAVLDRYFTSQFQTFATELAAAEHTVEARKAVLERWWEKVVGEQKWRLLAVEFSAFARKNRRLQGQLAERERIARPAIAALIEEQCRQLGLTPVLPAADLAVVIPALGAGLALQRAADPTIRASLVTDTLWALLGVDRAPAAATPVSAEVS